MSANLTGLAVSRHKFPDRDLLDAASPGLRLVANRPLKGGSRRSSWVYRYRTRDGKLRQIKLGQFPAMGLADARKAWSDQKAIRDDPSRGDPRAEMLAAKRARQIQQTSQIQQAYSVERLCLDYLSEHIDRVRKKKKEPRRLLEREVVAHIGEVPAISVSRAAVHELVQRCIDRDAKRIAQMTLMELRSAFDHAINSGRLPETFRNPCEKVKAPTFKPRTRAFSEAELQVFIAWLRVANISRSVRDAMALELMTSARQGEIVSMSFKDVDLERGVWHQPSSKNGKPHDVMLPKEAVKLIRRRVGMHAEWVFPRPDGKTHIASKAVSIQQYAAKGTAGLADWTVHDLRRSALTGLARLGCPRVVQDRISNHVDSSIAAIYDTHKYDAEAKAWLQRWMDHLVGLGYVAE